MDLHHNLFYSYRGATAGCAERDRQIENNLTKALINTLSLGGEHVWRPFLADLDLPAATHARFLMQRDDLPSGGACKKRHRVLLGISKSRSEWAPGSGSCVGILKDMRLRDAWVYGDGFAILVESKVSGDFSMDQMSAHLACLGTANGPAKLIKRTWGEVHSFFRELCPRVSDASSRLLIAQFVQFLEYSAMTGFTGFQIDHFQYFLMPDDDDARLWIREQMADFAACVLDQLQRSAPFYEAFDVGVLRLADSSCWMAFGPPGYRNVTHQTVSLGADGLRVFVNSELKRATDRLKQVLQHRGPELRSALQHLHRKGSFELVLEERTQRQASLYHYTPKMRLHSSMLIESAGDVAWSAFSETVNRLPLPYVRIERLVPAATLIQLSKRDEAIQYVEQILEQNHTVVHLMNTPED